MAVVQEGEASASASAFGLETIFGNRFIYTGQRLPIQPSGAYQRRPHYAHQNGQFGQQLIDEVRALNPRCSFHTTMRSLFPVQPRPQEALASEAAAATTAQARLPVSGLRAFRDGGIRRESRGQGAGA